MNIRNAATIDNFYIPFALLYFKNKLCARDELKLQVKNRIAVALSILGEPSNITQVTNSVLCKLFNADYMECRYTLSIINPSTNPTHTGIRRHSEPYTNVPLSNKFMILQSEVNLKSQTNMDHREKPSNIEKTISNEMKNEIHPFYVEFSEIGGRKIAQEDKSLATDNTPIVLKGKLLKIQPKSEDQFRIIQQYLDSKPNTFTPLHSEDQRLKKICMRGIPPGTESQLIIDYLALHCFTAPRAAILKNRKT